MTFRDTLWNHNKLAFFFDSYFKDPKFTVATHGNVNIGTTSGVVVNANPNRKYLLIVNDSSTKAYTAIGQVAAQNKGIQLAADGGYYEMTFLNLATGTISAITSVASVNLSWMEGQ